MYLSDEFVSKYEGVNPFSNNLANFVYLRTYSRWLDDAKRRENWLETCRRSVEYSMSLYKGPKSAEDLRVEAEQFFADVFAVDQLPAGRTLWVGGTDIVKKLGTANYNCAYCNITEIEDFHDVFYLLMVGCGVGFSVQKKHVDQLPTFSNSIDLEVLPYAWNQSYADATVVSHPAPGVCRITIGDSREGWALGLLEFINALTRKDLHAVEVNMNNVRPAGERLKQFGGKASGPEPYIELLTMVHEVITTAPAVNGRVQLRPVDVLDVCNVIAEGVVAGGVRRSSELALFDADDDLMLHAKDRYWESTRTKHRKLSNNSIAFWRKPSLEYMMSLTESIKNSYEPGFINMQSGKSRRDDFEGVNPCAETLMTDSEFCNLSSTFMNKCIVFVDGIAYLDVDKFHRLLRQSTRHSMRINNVHIELPKWDEVQKTTNLIGVNISGVEDAFAQTVVDGLEAKLFDDTRMIRVLDNGVPTVRSIGDMYVDANREVWDEGVRYADEMGVPVPVLMCLVQPSGTLSQLVGCSSGFHDSFAPQFIRRVRINSFDALAQTIKQLGYPVFPEVGQGWRKLVEPYASYAREIIIKRLTAEGRGVTADTDPLVLANSKDFLACDSFVQEMLLSLADTWVVEFAVKTSATKQAADVSAVDQFKRYLTMQNTWSDHNVSATIQVANDEWEDLFKLIHDRWDDYMGVSFQNKSNDKYDLAPYEAISEEEYEIRAAREVPIDLELLMRIENGTNSADADLGDGNCAGGHCPVR